MKKKCCLAVLLLLFSGVGSTVYGTETLVTNAAILTEKVIIPTMTFSKDIKILSLIEAQKKMVEDSPSKAVIDFHKQQGKNQAVGHLESVQSLNDIMGSGNSQVGSKATRDVERYLRNFANAQVEPNYEAEINKLSMETTTKYYQLKYAENMERITTENYNLKKILLSNTEKKKELGTVSNMEVLQAKNALNTSKDELFKAQNDLKSAKMAFNVFIGYNLMQSVSLTDSLKQVELPSKKLETSIKEALVNRNEIKAAEHGVKYAALGIAVYDGYPKDSAKVLRSKLAFIEAEKAKVDVINGVEMDVRNKYITIKQKYEAITTGQKNVANAKESVRLAQLQYDLGMTTLTTVNDAQIVLNRAEVGLSQNLLDYNLAVEEYNYASGVGTTTAQIN